MIGVIILLLNTICIVSSQTSLTPCGLGDLPTFFQAGTCTTSPCTFIRGSSVSIKIVYTYPVGTLIPLLKLTLEPLSGFYFPVELVFKACTSGPCPVTTGQTVTYQFYQEVYNWIPTGSFKVTGRLYTTVGQQLFCAYTNVIITV
ncbi:hypothetical protein RN001_010202 [Aquatica leii]|uniref:MD-2-related lipid-recognition domain-containing protein n=1 Tax=Aquatica leii TaxID=1421715 RepID=A0AAN7S8G9_9COLE|nr:hypothetical protein RN001_010202 [Aquatica leii]